MPFPFVYNHDKTTGYVQLDLFVDGQQIQVTNANKNFGLILQKLKEGCEDAKEIMHLYTTGTAVGSMKHAFESLGDNVARYDEKSGDVWYNGEKLDGRIVSAIQECVEVGLPIDSHLRFIENLMQNPSKHSVDQLYPFVEKNGLTITEDGCMLVYKVVKGDFNSVFVDKKTGKPVNWGVGSTVSMSRNKISDDPRSHCSQGLHVGGLDYVRSFHSSPDRHILVCKVNPKDVVSVPNDLCTKIRVCEAKVLSEYFLPKPLDTKAVYNDDVEAVYSPNNCNQYSWDDEEDWDGWEELDDFEDDDEDDLW